MKAKRNEGKNYGWKNFSLIKRKKQMNLALFGKVRIAPEIRACSGQAERIDYLQFWEKQFDHLEYLLGEFATAEIHAQPG
jgi:hypothetical protein